ncbi:hypothetical protein Amsp01_097690 [Amycolatopsis sp. NBRC 101858]|uniref:hypothetical protein n=1 Tax=Amycolatopsis sp. NBRC 101858 TaxID=3032200 RepID=UPI00249F9599|nr:hypothetical protein [Amycolatopsis sp. NBRC 101858]GLY43746.1 hypothetical protein Amsp01_097690 [Amycolatopsis sp. NBRC 101858]
MPVLSRTRKNGRKWARAAAVTAVAGVALSVVTAVPASADVVEIPVGYTVTGSTVVKKTGGSMALGPGTLDGALIIDDQTGSVGLRANLSLPPSQADISLVSGIFRIKAKVKITPTGPATGTIADATLTTHAQANMEIYDIWAGLIVPVIPIPTVPGSCKASKPLDLDLSAKDVDIFGPKITVTGTYTIPEFKNCFIADLALGALISGPGNTISLDLAAKTEG